MSSEFSGRWPAPGSPSPSRAGFPLLGGRAGIPALSRRALLRGSLLGAGAVAAPRGLAAGGGSEGGATPKKNG